MLFSYLISSPKVHIDHQRFRQKKKHKTKRLRVTTNGLFDAANTVPICDVTIAVKIP